MAALIGLVGCGDDATKPQNDRFFDGPLAYQVGGAGEEFLGGVAISSAGQRILACDFQGTVHHVNLADSSRADTLEADGRADVLLVGYGPDGNPLWRSTIGGAGEQKARAVAATPYGTVVCGLYEGETRIAGSDRQGFQQAFVAGFDRTGIPLWGFNSVSGFPVSPSDLAADANGNVYLAGTFKESIDLGSFHGAAGTSPTGFGGFLAKIDAGGQAVDVEFTHGAVGIHVVPFTSLAGVDVAEDGSVYACGEFQAQVLLSGLSSQGPDTRHGLVFKRGPEGRNRWLGAALASKFGFAAAIDVAVAGERVFLVGAMSDSVRFGGGVNLFASGLKHFVACYDTSGVPQWATLVGDDQLFLTQVKKSDDTDVLVTASFTGSLSLGGHALQSRGMNDLVAFRMNAEGQITAVDQIGGGGDDSVLHVAVGNGTLLYGGQTFGDLSLGEGLEMHAAGQRDVFVLAP